eukprot:TRINITY_DN19443_c0_g1_i2.p1 TRINITY_DN19443_c0_g1~~TRINITY_DN19443_c0_g1_i2.p1  ORF type:complete len:122 (+),score=0.99 TRINITY_DN19443_c0_g1_i2:89-454(+)
MWSSLYKSAMQVRSPARPHSKLEPLGTGAAEPMCCAASFVIHPFSALVVVQLQTHPVLDLVVLQGDVILINVVPLLNADLLPSSTALRCYQLLQISDCVVRIALDPNLAPDSVVANDLDHD